MPNKCTELAKISLPWAGQIVNFCPVHANKLVIIANAMGAPIKPRLLNELMQCESEELLTDEEKTLNLTFGTPGAMILSHY